MQKPKSNFPTRLIRKQQYQYTLRMVSRKWQLYVMFFIPFLWVIVFSYVPMYGVQIAFRDFTVTKGITGSNWVGLKHFNRFISSYMFNRVVTNTLAISIYQLLVGFPMPILFALLINECRNRRYAKVVQMVSYAPHFITTVVIVAIIIKMLDYHNGVANALIIAFGGQPVYFLGEAELFRHIYVLSNVWQNIGFNSIIYVAALSAIDPALEEAAVIDGANRLHKIWHINIPGIMPTIIIMLILRMGQIMNIGYEKIYLMQNTINANYSEVISTYVYKLGIQQTQYSFSTAVNLFNSIINLVLIVSVNQLARRLGDTTLW
ncbi:MAG: sugar ABC transporter permease [Clostridiales bacterium]|jgi:putative aldouronate transport system permease protein|nr:sugar ABC transporter permease [Clostridiales bacterium]